MGTLLLKQLALVEQWENLVVQDNTATNWNVKIHLHTVTNVLQPVKFVSKLKCLANCHLEWLQNLTRLQSLLILVKKKEDSYVKYTCVKDGELAYQEYKDKDCKEKKGEETKYKQGDCALGIVKYS